MHLLLVKDDLRRFDAGTDYLYCDHSFLVWRHARQRLPNGILCATVEGCIGNWQITPFANMQYIKNIDQLPGTREWLDGQSGTRFQPNGLDVHHQSDYHDILAPVEGHVELRKRYELMNRFMREKFGASLWMSAYDEPLGNAGIQWTYRHLRNHLVADLLSLQAAS